MRRYRIISNGFDPTKSNRVPSDDPGGKEPIRIEFPVSDGGDLADDLKGLTADDFGGFSAAMYGKKKKSPLDRLFIPILLICAAIFVYAVAQIIVNVIAQKNADAMYSALADSFFGDEEGAETEARSSVLLLPEDRSSLPLPDISVKRNASQSANSTHVNEELERFRTKLHALAEENPDTYGWIVVEGTNINYPVVQGSDDEYYLNRSFQRKYHPYGSIFADFICSRRIDDNFNTVLYGHNVTSNGTMFNGVTSFLDKGFFDAHGEITLYTLDGIYTYRVFSIYETDYAYHYRKTDFETGEKCLGYVKEFAANSLWSRSDFEPDENVRILTLSTCTSSLFSTRRYALHAELVGVVK